MVLKMMKNFEKFSSLFWIVLALLTLTSKIIFGQDNINFRHLSIDDGLSQNMITDILQDSKGFMWFATWDGLNRYDGYNFKIYKHIEGDSTSLRINKISCLLEDNTGRLWVGTFGGGLSLFNRDQENFTNFIHNSKDSSSIISGKIISIFQDSKNRIWIGTSNIGASLIEESELNNLSNTSSNIDFVNFQKEGFDPYSLKGNGIRSFEEDENGTIWLGSYDGWLNKLLLNNNLPEEFEFLGYHPNMEKEKNFSNLSFEELLKDKLHPELIWITDYYNGIIWFDSESEKFVYNYPFDNLDKNIPIADIKSILKDNGE